jgi:hypothetical protein
MTGPGTCVYDDPTFSVRYQQTRQRGTGLNEDLEQPALTPETRAMSGTCHAVPGDHFPDVCPEV